MEKKTSLKNKKLQTQTMSKLPLPPPKTKKNSELTKSQKAFQKKHTHESTSRIIIKMIYPPSKEFDGDPRPIHKTKKMFLSISLTTRTPWPSCKDKINSKSPISMRNGHLLELIAADQTHLENGKIPATTQKKQSSFFSLKNPTWYHLRKVFPEPRQPFLMLPKKKIHLTGPWWFTSSNPETSGRSQRPANRLGFSPFFFWLLESILHLEEKPSKLGNFWVKVVP